MSPNADNAFRDGDGYGDTSLGDTGDCEAEYDDGDGDAPRLPIPYLCYGGER